MPTSPELLLYSLAEYRELLLALLGLTRARHVVEVGSGDCALTRELVAWARASGGTVTCVEPAPTDELRAWDRAGDVRLVEARSPAALASAPPADAYLLDGDHNYFTVQGELEAIDAARFRAGKGALVVLHDVGWPSGRRDAYYAPSALPPDAVHPHSFERGVALGEPGLVEGGFRGMGAFAFAEREGGPRNGVRTALEDFLAGRDDLVAVVCPLVFGAAFVFPRGAPWAAAAEEVLRRWAQHPMLERVEENRLALYLRVLADQDRRPRELAALEAERARSAGLERRAAELERSAAEVEQRAAELERGAAEVEQRAAELERRVDRLGRRAAELEGGLADATARLEVHREHAAAEREHRAAAEARLAAIEESLSHRVAARVQRLKERVAPRGTARRRACDAAISALKAPGP